MKVKTRKIANSDKLEFDGLWPKRFREFQLVEGRDFGAIYRQVDRFNVFQAVLQESWCGASCGVSLIWPADEDYGKLAWNMGTLEGAKRKLDELRLRGPIYLESLIL